MAGRTADRQANGASFERAFPSRPCLVRLREARTVVDLSVVRDVSLSRSRAEHACQGEDVSPPRSSLAVVGWLDRPGERCFI